MTLTSLPPFGTFFQLGYVTADLEKAKQAFASQRGISGYHEFDTRDAGIPGSTGIKVALGYSAGVMVELIEPDPDSPGVYGDALNADRVATLHHFGYLLGQNEFDSCHGALVQAQVSVPVLLNAGGMCLLYADTRAEDGLFTELVVPTQITRNMFGAIPDAPPPHIAKALLG